MQLKGAQAIGLNDIAKLFDGHADCLVTAESVQPVRYRLTDAPFLDAQVKMVGAFLGGVRLRLKTDSRTLRLAVTQVHASIPGREWWTTDYEVHIDGKLARNVSAVGGARIVLGGTISGDPQAVLALDDLPAG